MITDPYELGPHNRNRIREFLITHPGASQKECARALGLGAKTVHKHVKTIRAEWRGKAGG